MKQRSLAPMSPQRPTRAPRVPRAPRGKPLPVAPVPAGPPPRGAADLCEVRCIDAPTVTRVRAEMPAAADVARAAERLRLLGDPTRLRLLAALARAEELCV